MDPAVRLIVRREIRCRQIFRMPTHAPHWDVSYVPLLFSALRRFADVVRRSAVFIRTFGEGFPPQNLQFAPPNSCKTVCSVSFFRSRQRITNMHHGNFPSVDNKHRKLFVIKQSKGCEFMPKMHRNTFGGRAPPRRAHKLPHTPSLGELRTRSTQPCIPPGSLNRVPGFGWGKGGNVTSAGWQVTLCDPIRHVSSRSGVATMRTAIHLLLTYLLSRNELCTR